MLPPAAVQVSEQQAKADQQRAAMRVALLAVTLLTACNVHSAHEKPSSSLKDITAAAYRVCPAFACMPLLHLLKSACLAVPTKCLFVCMRCCWLRTCHVGDCVCDVVELTALMQVVSLAGDCVDDQHAVDKLTEYTAVEKVGEAIQATLKLAQQLTTGTATGHARVSGLQAMKALQIIRHDIGF